MSWNQWWRPRTQKQARGPWSRRAFIAGGGAVITLPFLESLSAPAWASGNGSPCPTRLIFYHTPNGMMMNDWTPNATGLGYDLPRILSPLASIQDQVSVLTNLTNRPAIVPVAGDHARGTGSFLSCATVTLTDGDDIYNGISVDQVAAQAIGDQTMFPSLELGTAGGASVGDCDSGYSCAYARNISWSTANTPMPKMTDAQLVFDRLFAGFDTSLTEEQLAQRREWRASVLDRTTTQISDLNGKLSTSDKAKLDEYLSGVRDLEVRIQSGFTGACAPPGTPGSGLTYAEQVATMNALMVKALECDLTRVVTFMMENAGSNRSFDFLGVTGSHHELSHHQDDFATIEQLVTIETWEVQQFADLCTQLDAVQEADGSTLLDNTLAYFSSEIADGNSHAHTNLPVLLAGSGGGRVTPGRHIDFGTETAMANLFLTMLDSQGVQPGSFGDSTGLLDLSV